MDCDVCAGTGKPVSGLPCICGGTGSNIDEKAGLRRKVHEMELQVSEMEKLIKRVDDYFCKPEFGLYDSAAVLIVPPDLAMAVRTIAEKRKDEACKHATLNVAMICEGCGMKFHDAEQR